MRTVLITPTLGDSPWLEQTLASATGLCEHWIVCPSHRARGLAARHPGLRVVAESGRGLYGAIQGAVDDLPADAVFSWINDDDLIDPHGARTLLAHLAGKPAAGIAYGLVRLVSEDGRDLAGIPVARRGEDIGPLIGRGVVPIAQPGTWIRVEAFRRVGGFDPSLGAAADLDFWARAVSAGVRCDFVGAEAAAFRVRAGQLSQGARAAQETAAVFARHRRPGGTAAIVRFKTGNLALYLERILRGRGLRMRTLQAGGARA